jgi:hypothetical protein
MIEVGASDTYLGRQSGTYPASHGIGISGIRSDHPRVGQAHRTARYRTVPRDPVAALSRLTFIDGRLECVREPVGVEASKE